MAVVLNEFRWSPDGYTIETLKPGDERNFGAATAGLLEEGFVSAEPAAEAALNEDVDAVAGRSSGLIADVIVEPVFETPAEPAAEAARPTRKRK